MSINCIIFDLDDTLCDWKKASAFAKAEITKRLKEEALDQDTFWRDFSNSHETLYSEFTSGKISKEIYRVERFLNPLLAQGVRNKELANEFNRTFVERANNSIAPLIDLRLFFENIRKHPYKVALLTNGPSDGQRRKIEKLNIECYFDHIFISEEVGFGKPELRAFCEVLDKFGLEPKNSIMVGDSWDIDIAPALQLGMHGYWIGNRFQKRKEVEKLAAGPLEDLELYLTPFRKKSSAENS